MIELIGGVCLGLVAVGSAVVVWGVLRTLAIEGSIIERGE